MAKPKAPAFEKSLAQLETIVQQMDSGELTLEQSLQSFEKGIKLIRQCQESLNSAQERVQELIETNGELQSVDFEGDDD